MPDPATILAIASLVNQGVQGLSQIFGKKDRISPERKKYLERLKKYSVKGTLPVSKLMDQQSRNINALATTKRRVNPAFEGSLFGEGQDRKIDEATSRTIADVKTDLDVKNEATKQDALTKFLTEKGVQDREQRGLDQAHRQRVMSGVGNVIGAVGQGFATRQGMIDANKPGDYTNYDLQFYKNMPQESFEAYRDALPSDEYLKFQAYLQKIGFITG